MNYEKIAEVVGVDLNEENSEDKIIEKVLSDDYYFDIGEVYYGGYWDDDFPNDF